MDPKAQFEARYKAYIEKRNLTLNQAHLKEAQDIVQGGAGGPKIKFGYALLLLLALAVPSTVLLLGQQQDIRQRASGPENVVPQGAVKQVGTTYITNSDVDLRLQQLYGTNSAKFKDDIKVRQVILDQLIRERIIQQEAEKRGISVNEKEIEESRLKGDAPQTKKIAHNLILEEKLKDKVISWKLVDYAVVFSENQDNSIKASLEKLKSEVKNGKSIKEAYDNLKSTQGFYNKMRIVESEKVYQAGTWDQIYSDQLFKYNKKETTDIIEGNGSYRIAFIRDENVTQYRSFEDWYNQLKK